jgi:NAD(P)-dependent dehydrogenase (short-subunit alcohol dehydrogenase family)
LTKPPYILAKTPEFCIMPSIRGQFILIIGGTSGIGIAVAKLALAESTHVAIASSNPSRVASAVEELKSLFPDGRIEGHQIDLSHDDVETHLEKLFTDVTAGGSDPLDHVVYTAGGTLAVKPIHEIDIDFIHNAGHVRFVVPLLVAKLAYRFTKSSTASSLILTTGSISQKPVADWSVVASYATGLHGMTRNLALDLAPLRVNLVSPGATDTDLWGPNRAQMQEAAKKDAFMGKLGTPEEVAEAYIYLMKDTNSTGGCVTTSGGNLLK